MSSALIQLVATGPHDQPINNALAIITHTINTHIQFGQSNRFNVSRQCDVIKSIYFKFKMAPLPVGWIYKNRWAEKAFENIELSIGGQVVLKHTKEKQIIFNLIFPPKNTNRHMNFDYTLEERRNLSLQPHESIFELDIQEIFGNGIPVLSMSFHETQVNFTLGNFEDCIETDRTIFNETSVLGNIAPPLNPELNYILECLPQSIGLFLDMEPRRTLSQTVSRFITKNYQIASTIVDSSETTFNINQDGICSAAYIHITNEDGTEIPNQIIDNLKVLLNSSDRFNISGFQSRHQIPSLLPHPTLDNNTSQNLYYISYNSATYIQSNETPTTEQQAQAQAQQNENGLNLSRIDSYKFNFRYNNTIPLPPRIKISVIHRNQNVFMVQSGMGGYRFSHNEPQIMTETELQAETDRRLREQEERAEFLRNNPDSRPVLFTSRLPSAPRNLSFIPCDTLINIPTDDNSCIITMEPIEPNNDIVQCNQCRKICMMEAMNEWFKTSKTCPHCRASHNGVSAFNCGKANYENNMVVDILI
jgi:hypothetical protein